MRVALVTAALLVLMCISGMNARECCIPNNEPYAMFPERGITDYIILPNAVAEDLSSITLCFFFKPDPAEPAAGYHGYVPFSYATGGNNGNDIYFQTSPSLIIIVAGYEHDTGVQVSRGSWHQVCFTWQSSDGAWQLYLNGELAAQGTDFATGVTIRKGGILVLGQDQDTATGPASFDAKQAFLGGLSEVNLWDKVLSQSDVEAHCEGCKCHMTASTVTPIISWSDLRKRAEINGGVQMVCG